MTQFKMTHFKILGAAALLATALASPAMSQEMIAGPARCSNASPNANCQTWGQNSGPGYAGTSYHRAHRADRGWQDGGWQDRGWQDSYNRYDSGSFWPAEAAAGVVGGAVGTAAAIATAPIGGSEYARVNGFVCTPGTWFRGDDGRAHPCQ
jgi:hypothetical protein